MEIYQTINYLLEEKKVDEKRILLFSGDDPSLFFNENDTLNILKLKILMFGKNNFQKI